MDQSIDTEGRCSTSDEGSLLFGQDTHPSKDTKRVHVCSTVTTCLQVLDRDPSNVAALEQLGLAYDGIHQYQKAQTALASAAHLDPKSVRIQYELGGVEEELHRREHALEAYERSVALDPYSPTALLNLGDTHAELHRYDDAIKAYRVVITLKPTYARRTITLEMSSAISSGTKRPVEPLWMRFS